MKKKNMVWELSSKKKDYNSALPQERTMTIKLSAREINLIVYSLQLSMSDRKLSIQDEMEDICQRFESDMDDGLPSNVVISDID